MDNAEWIVICSNIPVKERDKIMLDTYNRMDADCRIIVDELVNAVMAAVKLQSKNKRFSKSMAREIVFNAILFESIKYEQGLGFKYKGYDHELH